MNRLKVKQYKHITIKQVGNELYEEKPLFTIFNNKTNDPLGQIYFYKPYNQYVFSSKEGCIFGKKCLTDVVNFLKVNNE